MPKSKLLPNKMSKHISPPFWKSLLAGAINPILWMIFKLVPRLFGLRWIPGWPMSCMYLCAFIISVPVLLRLWDIRLGVRPNPELTRKQKLTRNILLPILVLALIALVCFLGFYGYPKTVDYLHSPNRARTAVVLEDKSEFPSLTEDFPWMNLNTKVVYPVRAWVFYEKEQGVGLITDNENRKQTQAWIDDNTLEFVLTFTGVFDGIDPFIEYIRW